MDFTKALEIVLKHEGGYVWDPDDAGGETNKGISKRAYPHLDIKNITDEQVAHIYKTDYWDRCKCDNLPSYLRLFVFDTAVNMGTGRAKKMLQKAVDVVVDGAIGPKSLAAASAKPKNYVIMNLTGLRWARYHAIAKRGRNRKFINGWLNRLADITKETLND